MDGVGNFVVAWDGEGASDNKGIYARRYDSSGNALRESPQRQPHDHRDAATMTRRSPPTWERFRSGRRSLGIFADTSRRRRPIRVNTNIANDQKSPAVAMDDGEARGASAATPSTDGVYGGGRRRARDITGRCSTTSTATGTSRRHLPRIVRSTDERRDHRRRRQLRREHYDRCGGRVHVQRDAARDVLRRGGFAHARSGSVWAEQTYGIAGAALGAGFTGATGALYGGRSAAVSDDASALTTAEHVTKVLLAVRAAPGPSTSVSASRGHEHRDGDNTVPTVRCRGPAAVHPERERHGRHPGGELLHRRRRAAHDQPRGGPARDHRRGHHRRRPSTTTPERRSSS